MIGTAISADIYTQVALGTGHDATAVTEDDLLKTGFLVYLELILFIAVMLLAKVSMCLSYRRILYMETPRRIILEILIAILIAQGIAMEVYSIFLCNPISAFWTTIYTWDTRCKDVSISFFMSGATNLITDVILICMMLPQVLHLKVNQRQRIALLTVVSLGWLAVAAGILRLVRVSKVLIGNDVPGWDVFDISIWTCLEVHISLFCASAPYSKPLITRLMPKLLGSNGTEFQPTLAFATAIPPRLGGHARQDSTDDALLRSVSESLVTAGKDLQPALYNFNTSANQGPPDAHNTRSA